ncbi:MAG: hypothetical protein DRG59_12195 [Deltaproteobacteria bacterium]|nr:MAG: hypothetical protein DRG83_16165 [Deltaproteobacteria bacterium]RLB03013.1 MAG: hypothetical protein DRG59_12195 [Deltaproteobacteria bacterium]
MVEFLSDVFMPLLVILMAGIYIVQHIYFKKKIARIGKTRCSKCGYTGIFQRGGSMIDPKIVCPICKSELIVRI